MPLSQETTCDQIFMNYFSLFPIRCCKLRFLRIWSYERFPLLSWEYSFACSPTCQKFSVFCLPSAFRFIFHCPLPLTCHERLIHVAIYTFHELYFALI